MNKEIDCIGLFCPIPIVKAKIAYKNIKSCESINIITDHSCTPQGIKDAFKNYNCKIEIEEEGGIWSIKITKL